MQASKVICPHCQSILKATRELFSGEQVQCLKCQAPFSVSARDLSLSIATESTVSSLLVPASLPASMPREYPVAVAFAAPPTKKRAGAAVAAWAALALSVGGGVGLACYFAAGRGLSSDEVTVTTKPTFTDNSPSSGQIDVPVPPGNSPAPPDPAATKPRPLSELPNADLPVPKVPEPRGTEPVPAGNPVVLKTLPSAEQQKVNEAIERGVKYLKANQNDNGSWLAGGGFHSVGYAALPGLTLLECNVPPTDPALQRAAAFVRRNCSSLNQTYDLALAILFLDRLGQRSDRSLIQQLTLRLVAGQTARGGWDYDCPLLGAPEATELMMFLHQTRPKAARLLDPMTSDPKVRHNTLEKTKTAPLADPLLQQGPGQTPLPKDRSQDRKQGLLGHPLPGTDAGAQADKKERQPKVLPRGQLGKEPPAGFPPEFLPNQKRKQQPPPVMVFGRGRHPFAKGRRDDNSNSQFAMLALWAARRHGVPTENTLALADQRYHSSQNADGGWGYVDHMPTTSAMTGVGLLGLAVGHGASEAGLLAAAHGKKGGAKNLLRDPAIQNGLQAFSQFIGSPDLDNPRPPMANLYFLWTVERVAMLYNLKTIGDKDWYGWGVHVLVPNQSPEGSWFSGMYPGSAVNIDTCFALLFLKRSNLVQDLTENLDLYLAIENPASKKR